MSGGVRWEDPPSPERSRAAPRSVWWDRLEPLMAEPGRWARILDDIGASVTTPLNQRRYDYPPGRWEFRAVLHDGNRNRCVLYARYLGPTP